MHLATGETFFPAFDEKMSLNATRTTDWHTSDVGLGGTNIY